MTLSVESRLLAAPVRHLDLSDYTMVTPTTTVRETVEQMRETRRHTAFIVGDHTVLQGIITDRDVLKKVTNQPSVWDVPITDLMTPQPATILPTATTGEALRLMEEGHFRNVPVVNEKGTPVGNVTYFALIDYLSQQFHQVVLNQPPTLDYASRRDGG